MARRNLCVHTEYAMRVRAATRTRIYTYNVDAYYVSRTNNSVGNWLKALRCSDVSPHLPPASYRHRVPSRLRVLDSVFAVVLNGGENRSNVNSRGAFATLMKSPFSNTMVDISREIRGEVVSLRICEYYYFIFQTFVLIVIVICCHD